MINDITKQLSEGITALCRANMKQHKNIPIRSSEMGVLIYITQNNNKNGIRSIDISNYFGIRKSSVSSIIASLEKGGYITRTLSNEDKRYNPIFPSAAGKQLVNNTINQYHQKSIKIIEQIGVEKCKTFLETLEQITNIIKNGDN